jgi:arylsulfatase A-like enzyme
VQTRCARLAFLVALLIGCADGAQRPGPNFVVVLVDDQGWTGTSVAMHERRPDSKSDFYRTPELAAFAARAMRFSSAYSPAPTCSPSRASLLTGKSPAQLRMTVVPELNPTSPRFRLRPPPSLAAIPAEEVTLPEALALSRPEYVSAHFGKWHLAGGGPEAHGFDQSDGEKSRGGRIGGDNPKDIFGITERGVAFMREQVAAGRPFYLQLSHYALHLHARARPQTEQAARARAPGFRHHDALYAAMTEDLDTGFGQLLAAIDDLGIRDRTYLIYLSDNGGGIGEGASNNRPLAQGKGTLWEGGIRIPMLVAGPGVTRGAISHVPVIGWDVLPTLLDLAGAPLPEGVEGGSLRALLEADGTGVVQRPRPGLVWHVPNYSPVHHHTPQSAYRLGDHKLVRLYETHELRLYDLSWDLSEMHELSSREPERTLELERLLDAHLDAVGAARPIPNPDYRPRGGAASGSSG